MSQAKDDRWLAVPDPLMQELFKSILDRLDQLDTNGTGATVPNGSITTSKLADGAVDSDKLGSNSVGTSHIADSAVGASKIGGYSTDLDASGSLTLPNGFNLRWTTASVTTGGTVDLGFPTACLAVSLTPQSAITFGATVSGNTITVTHNGAGSASFFVVGVGH